MMKELFFNALYGTGATILISISVFIIKCVIDAMVGDKND